MRGSAHGANSIFFVVAPCFAPLSGNFRFQEGARVEEREEGERINEGPLFFLEFTNTWDKPGPWGLLFSDKRWRQRAFFSSRRRAPHPRKINDSPSSFLPRTPEKNPLKSRRNIRHYDGKCNKADKEGGKLNAAVASQRVITFFAWVFLPKSGGQWATLVEERGGAPSSIISDGHTCCLLSKQGQKMTRLSPSLKKKERGESGLHYNSPPLQRVSKSPPHLQR